MPKKKKDPWTAPERRVGDPRLKGVSVGRVPEHLAHLKGMSVQVADSSTRFDKWIAAPATRPRCLLCLCGQGLETGAQLFRKDRWLLPSGEVAAFAELVVADELRIGLLSQVAQRRVDLAKECTDAHRQRDALGER